LEDLDANCSTAFVNFGQWALSYASGKDGRPYTVAEFGAAVDELLALLPQFVHQHRKRVWWTSINAFPHGYNVAEHRDWRWLVPLRLFNAVASARVTAAGLRTVDFSDVAYTLSELSYDMAHYKAPVERQRARLLLHALVTHKLS
jgi:hypothetical protein